MSLLLTDDEIAALCKPLKQGYAQARHLSQMLGCQIKRRPDGLPIVTRQMLERLDTSKAPQNDAGINWSRR
jgi:hypothetical protein